MQGYLKEDYVNQAANVSSKPSAISVGRTAGREYNQLQLRKWLLAFHLHNRKFLHMLMYLQTGVLQCEMAQ